MQLDTLPLRTLPLSGHEGGVGLGNVAGLGEEEGHGLLGGRQDVRLRRVDHHDAPLGGGGHVDVVEPDAGPADDHEIATGLEHLGGHRRGRADDERLGPRHRGHELIGREIELHVDLVARIGQKVETRAARSSR